jgi:RNA recognition motif-containing protein
MNIYVGNLNYNFSEDELKEIFEEFGEVSSAKIISDKYSGRSKGFGFVEMANDTEAQEAIENLNDKDVGGRNIKVNQAREKTDAPRRNFR